MTIMRLGQFSAELQTTADVTVYSGSSVPTISNTKAKTGTYSWRIGGSASAPGISCSTGSLRMGFYLNHNGFGNGAAIFLLWLGSARIAVLADNSAAKLYLEMGYSPSSGGRNYAASCPIGAMGVVDTWRHYGLAAKIASSGGYVSFYIDGTRLLSVTGDTTIYPMYSTTKLSPTISGAYGPTYDVYTWTSYAYIDDLYIDDTTGEDDAPPPARRFLLSLPNGNGTNSQWTRSSGSNNFDMVKEAANDGDTTYVKALSADLVDTYTTADITVPADHTVAAVVPCAVAKKMDGAVDTQLKLVAYDGANTQVGTAVSLPTSYGVPWNRFTTRPDGGSWDQTSFNAAEFGIKSAGSF